MSARTEVRMRELDAFSWTREQDPLAAQDERGGCGAARHADWARVTERMDRLARAVPRFRQRVVEALSFPVYCSGAPVERFYSNSPTAGSAMNTTVISYRGVCNVGVNIDTAAVHDPEVLLDCLRHGFEEALALSGTREAASVRSQGGADGLVQRQGGAAAGDVEERCEESNGR